MSIIMAFFVNESSASHSAAANDRYENVGGNTYRVEFDFFRGCSGIGAPTPVVSASSPPCRISDQKAINI
jgi:hypothetical protein